MSMFNIFEMEIEDEFAVAYDDMLEENVELAQLDENKFQEVMDDLVAKGVKTYKDFISALRRIGVSGPPTDVIHNDRRPYLYVKNLGDVYEYYVATGNKPLASVIVPAK